MLLRIFKKQPLNKQSENLVIKMSESYVLSFTSDSQNVENSTEDNREISDNARVISKNENKGEINIVSDDSTAEITKRTQFDKLLPKENITTLENSSRFVKYISNMNLGI